MLNKNKRIMKKVLLVLMAMVVLGTVQAQSDFKGKVESATGTKFYFGPKFGFNVASISNGLEKSKFSFAAGGFAEFKFDPKASFLVELLYSRQGDGDKVNGTKYKWRMNYLNIPLMGKYYFYKNFSAHFGPQIGILLNSKTKSKNGGTEVKTDIDHTNTFELGLNFGVGYDFDWGLAVTARYGLGLTNVIDKDHYGDGCKNRVFQLAVGWRF